MRARVLIALTLAWVASTPVSSELDGQVNPGDSVAAAGQLREPGSELRVWLLTFGQGDVVWELFGHNALRVLNTETGRDASYKWGIFDFNQPGFVPRFLKGEMLYMMAPFATQAMIDVYAAADREVVMQELALTPAQRLRLLTLAETNALPENRDYAYDPLLDNCSTRVRDLIDQVLEGALFAQLGDVEAGNSYRTHIRRLTEADPIAFVATNYVLGSPGDQTIGIWEEMFVPMVLRDAIRDVVVTDEDGSQVPLVMSEEVVVPSSRVAEPDRAGSWLLRYLLLGSLMGGLLAWLGRRAAGGARAIRVLFGAIASGWSLLAGVSGTVLFFVLFTDHWSMGMNENLLLLNPLSMLLVVLVPMALLGRPQAAKRARAVGYSAAGLAALGLLVQVLPVTEQHTGMLFALFLPVHVGLAHALRGLESDVLSGSA